MGNAWDVWAQLTNTSWCDTFSRSSQAVFELSTRFAAPFKQRDGVSDDEKLEAERLMFLELTQGTKTATVAWEMNTEYGCSMLVG